MTPEVTIEFSQSPGQFLVTNYYYLNCMCIADILLDGINVSVLYANSFKLSYFFLCKILVKINGIHLLYLFKYIMHTKLYATATSIHLL